MKIGIGVCSYKRPELATKICKEILSTIDKSKYEIKTICSVDDTDIKGYEWIKDNFGLIYGPNGGISVNKNRLIKYLSDCDYLFISEDDISFKKMGWIDIYIKAIIVSKFQHFNYIVSDYRKTIKKALQYSEGIKLGITNGLVNGVLMVMTKECINKVGGFDLRYKKYGFEHADYTRRCTFAKLYPPFHVHVMESTEYINWVHSESVISKDEKEQYINYNRGIFESPSQNLFCPYNTVEYINA